MAFPYFRASRLSLTLLYCAGGIPAMAQPTFGTPPAVRSHVAKLKITLLTQLPTAPPSASSRVECGALREGDVTTQGGKIAYALGWGVIAEQTFGPYETVSFASDFGLAAGAVCEIDKGNVALFDGAKLVALIYAPSSAPQEIANISLAGDRLRIFDGSLAPSPVGDVVLQADGAIEIDPVAAEESVCGGKGVVPNLYGKSIDKVRTALFRKGWIPTEGPRLNPKDPLQSFTNSVRQEGIVEVQSCAPTGLAYCSYDYHKGAMTLDVISTGDAKFPTVTHYSVECEARK